MINNLKTRVLPILLLKNGILVRSREFNFHQVAGNPFNQVERFNNWNVDELIYLNISRKEKIDFHNNMEVIGYTSSKKNLEFKIPSDIFEFVKYLSKYCFMPLTFGGGLKNINQISQILLSGADKIVINTEAFINHSLISNTAKKFGSQCVVVSIDAKIVKGEYNVFINGGKEDTKVNVLDWALKAQYLGAGEILINSIDRDGTGEGYDLNLCKLIVSHLSIPTIIAGGVGNIEDFYKGYKEIKPSGLAAANIFHFKEHSDHIIKNNLSTNGVNVRI